MKEGIKKGRKRRGERREERGGALFYDPLSAKGFFAVVVVDEITLWA